MGQSFSKGLVISIGLVAAVIILASALSYHNTGQLIEDASSATQANEALDSLDYLVSTVKDAEIGRLGYLITGEDRYLESYNAAAADLRNKVGRVKLLTQKFPRQEANIQAIEKFIAAKTDESERSIALRKKDPQTARQIVLADEGGKVLNDLYALVNRMELEQHALLNDRQQQSRHSYLVAVVTDVLLAILGLAVVGFFVNGLRRYLLARDRAAALLHEQREWFRTTLGSIGDAVIATDAQGRVKFLNAVGQLLTGWTQQDAVDKPCHDVFHIINEKTRQKCENPVEKVLQLGTIVGLANHTALIGKDGVERSIADSGSPIRGSDGKTVGVVLVFRDITEHKLAEEAREQHRQSLTSLIRLSAKVVAAKDLQGSLQEVAVAARELTGARLSVCGHGYIDGKFLLGGVSRAEGLPACPEGQEFVTEKGGVYLDLIEKCDSLRLTDEQMRAHPAWWGLPDDHAPMRGLLGARLVNAEGQPNGMIMVSDKERGEFTEEDESLLKQLATIASLALQHHEARTLAEQQAIEATRAADIIRDLARFPDENPNPVLRIARDGSVLYANQVSGPLLSLWGTAVGQRLPDDFAQNVSAILDAGRPVEEEFVCDGQTFSCVLAPIAEAGYVNIYGRDVSTRKQAEKALHESREDLNRAQTVAHTGSWRLNVRRNELLWSDENHRMFGIPKNTPMTYETFLAAVHPDDRQRVDREWTAALGGQPYDIEHRIVVDGRVKWVRERAELEFDPQGTVIGGFGTTQDITGQRRAQQEREITVEFLSLVNKSTGSSDLIRAGAIFFQHQSGCQAVGVRVKDGDDYPYYEARGFPTEFVLAENSLCLRDTAGNVIRDSAGDPVIECMCGNVICGRFDPSKPFFTAHGSFWTNSTTQLLAGTTEADRQGPMRNRCNSQGYESLALLPLHVGEERLGLLQLNDRKKGAFTPEDIALWERLADHFAVALAKFRAEETLKESEERFRSVFEQAAVGIEQIDLDGRLLRGNGKLSEILGYTEVELTGLTCKQISHPDDFPAEMELLNRLVAGDIPFYSYEKRYIHKDGRPVWVRVTSSLARGTQQPYRISIIEDISQRIESERQLELSSRALESAANGIAITDRQGQIIWVNPAFTKLTGYSRAEAVGQNPRVLKSGQHPPEFYAEMWATIVHGNPWQGELVNRRKDGSLYTEEMTITPVRAGNDEITHFVAVKEDITQRKLAEEQLKNINETLERRVAERTAEAEHRAVQLRAMAAELIQTEQREHRRLAKVLHDNLQQILVAARMKVGLLRRRTKSDEPTTQMVDELNGLIDESIAESRSLTMELSPPVLYDAGLLAGLAWLSRRMKDKHGLAVEVVADSAAEPEDENLRIFLFEAARELLFNVVKHAQVQQAHIVLAKTPEGKLRIEVSDQGVGCDPRRSMDPAGKGGGFGLFSLRERLELLDGRLEIQSAPGKGMRIAVEVSPIEHLAAESPIEAPPFESPIPFAEPKGRGGLRVLLADDHPIVRKGLADMLREQPEIGAVYEARDGQEAVELALKHHPNVAVLDVTMPRMTGVEATREIKAQLPDVRIIGLSIHQSGDMAQAMIEAGADKYLRKDVPSEVLIAAILNEPRP